MNVFTARSKIWLEANGQAFLGDGRYRLLEAVERTGSINAAAREMGVSYRKAWSQLQAMEEAAPFPLLIRKVGGKDGGSSRLTPETRQLMKKYQQLRDRISDETERCALACFNQGELRP